MRRPRCSVLRCLLPLLLAKATSGALPTNGLPDVDLPSYDTRYYVIHTDLTGDALREVELRMTRMAEEYRARTRGFFGSADRKLPFYLFRRARDYYATGAPEESAGVFTGTALLAVAEEKTDLRTWHTIQHEGFHQYADAVIGSKLPTWANEGLAEYFGEAIFTGDGFVSGVIPQWRLDRIRKTFEAGEFMPLREMMDLALSEWNAGLSTRNYDQAWSMVQFLAHGDDGRYQDAFAAFLREIGRGKSWQVAWREQFGDVDAFETRWKRYWTSLPDDPTAPLYGRIAAEILTAFFARSYAQRQTFDSFEQFAAAADKGLLRASREDWLPPSLAGDGVRLGRELGTWSIQPDSPGRPPRLVLAMPDGIRVTGRFTLRGARVARVQADVARPRNPAPVTRPGSSRPAAVPRAARASPATGGAP